MIGLGQRLCRRHHQQPAIARAPGNEAKHSPTSVTDGPKRKRLASYLLHRRPRAPRAGLIAQDPTTSTRRVVPPRPAQSRRSRRCPGGRPRDTPIGKLEAALKCRSCKKRYVMRCKVCGGVPATTFGARASGIEIARTLTRHCCGRMLTDVERSEIEEGLDFRDGQWSHPNRHLRAEAPRNGGGFLA